MIGADPEDAGPADDREIQLVHPDQVMIRNESGVVMWIDSDLVESAIVQRLVVGVDEGVVRDIEISELLVERDDAERIDGEYAGDELGLARSRTQVGVLIQVEETAHRRVTP